MSFLLDKMGLDKIGLDEMGWHLWPMSYFGGLALLYSLIYFTGMIYYEYSTRHEWFMNN